MRSKVCSRLLSDYVTAPDIYPKMVSKFLLFSVESFSPVKVHDLNRGVSLWFWALFVNPTLCCTMIAIYVISEFSDLDLTQLAEDISMFCK